jgi:multidrug efflux system membrane fusion protein
MMARRIRIVGMCIAGLIAIVIIWQLALLKGTSAPKDGVKAGVPVRVVQSQLHDASTFLSTIATVQAFNTVTVRTRVDGEISRIAFREGQIVHRGEMLVELDRRPFEAQLRSAVGQRDKDKALLENAKLDLARYEFLVESGGAPTQTLDTTRSLVHQLDATINADEAQIDIARLQFTYATIRAPIDGRVGARLVDAGNIVHPTDATGLVVLAQTQPIAVSFSLPQKVLPVLRAQQAQHPLRVMAVTQDTSNVLDEGELTFIDNQIDAVTGTIRCKATFRNPKEILWPGQFVTTRILLQSLHNAVLIPTVAVQTGAKGPYVYVVKDNLAMVREVSAGQTMDDQTVVLSGLIGGESVVVEGQFQLEPGARVVEIASGSAGKSIR